MKCLRAPDCASVVAWGIIAIIAAFYTFFHLRCH